MDGITATVGEGGVNTKDDVSTVQLLLNRSWTQHDVPSNQIEVDGLWGPQTKSALTEFQKRYCKTVSRKFGPGDETIQKLNQVSIPRAALNDGKRYLTPKTFTRIV
jgi:peptidoglycan hydrolase-like protein with peptidoglycan-binding domain